jgi:uncharacterized repeat protein (TIGR02543 family)
LIIKKITNMNQNFTINQTMGQEKTLTNPNPAPIYTRARAHAHTRASRKPLSKSLLAGLAMMAVLLLGVGNTAWGQTPTPVEHTKKFETASSSEQTWTLPEGLYQITEIKAWGGGGGGGNAHSSGANSVVGSGGGGGAHSYFSTTVKLSTDALRTVKYKVGSGGSGGSSGGESTVTVGGTKRVHAGGGSNGSTAASAGSTSVNGGAGGTVPNGYLGTAGGTGGQGTIVSFGKFPASTWNRRMTSGGGGGCGGATSSNANGMTQGTGANGGGAGAAGKQKENASEGGNSVTSGYGGGGSGACKYGTNSGDYEGGKGASGAVWITYNTLHLTVKFKNNYSSDDITDYASATLPYYNTYGSVIPTNNPTRTGYHFAGWYFDQGCTMAVDGEEHCIKEENFNLYAKWIPCTVSINYDVNGGTPTQSEVSVAYDQITSSHLPTVTREGYIFDNWHITTGTEDAVTTVAELKGHLDCEDGTNGCTCSIALKAHWIARQYTITFNANPPATTGSVTWDINNCFTGGTYSDNNTKYTITRTYTDEETVYANNCVDLTSSLKFSGYVFEGWFTSVDGNDKKTYDDAISATNGINFPTDESQPGSITLYAHWHEAFLCNLHGEGGTFQSCLIDCDGQNMSQTDDGYAFELPLSGQLNPCLATCETNNNPLITLTGYHLLGWFKKNGNEWGDQVMFNQTDISNSVQLDLYAKWAPNSHTLTFNAHGNEADPASFSLNNDDTAKTQIFYDAKYNTAERNGVVGWNTHFGVRRPGFEFTGWYTEPKADVINQTATIPSDSIKKDDIFKQDNDNHVLYAGWKAKTFTVTFKLQQPGTTTPSVTPTSMPVVYNNAYGSLESLPTPVCEGYKFAGWYLENTYSNFIDSESPVRTAGDHDLFAKWTANDVNVVFKENKPETAGNVTWNITGLGNNHTYAGKYDQNLYTTDFNGSNAMSLTGYTFRGFYKDQNCTDGNNVTYQTKINSTSFTADQLTWTNNVGEVNLYAKWTPDTFNLAYDLNDGTGTAPATAMKVVYGEDYPLWTPTRTGYTFAGWCLDDDCDQPVTTATTVTKCTTVGDANNTITLHARWTANTVNVVFNANVPDATTGSVTWGSMLSALGDDHTYAGKYDQNVFTGDFNASGVVSLPGYTFGGFYKDASCTQAVSNTVKITESNFTIDWSDGTPKTGTVNLYAKWTANDVNVVFNANVPDATTGSVTWGSMLSALGDDHTYAGKYDQNVFTGDFNASGVMSLPGYTFGGFYKDASCTQAVSNTVKITENNFTIVWSNGTPKTGTVNLYAKWIPKTYSLKLHAEGNDDYSYATYPASFGTANGNESKTVSNITYDIHYNEITGWEQFDVKRTGFVFQNWNTKADGTGTNIGADRIFHDGDTASSFALFAQWEPDEYTVTFALNAPNGASTTSTSQVPDPKQVTYANAYGTLDDPTLTGYTFGGWFMEPACTNEVTATTICTTADNHYLYAKWTAKSVVVTFNGNGGDPESQQQTYTFDQKYNTLPTVVKTGYSYKWYNGSDQITGNSYCNQSNINWEDGDGKLTLTAQWTANTYTVTLDANGGSGSTSRTIAFDAKYSDLNGWQRFGVNRTGYTFAGWWTDQTSGERITANDKHTVPNGRTLYAHWTANQYECTLDLDGGTNPCGSNPFLATYDKPINYGCEISNTKKTGYYVEKWERQTGSNIFGATYETVTPSTTWKWTNDDYRTLYARWKITLLTVTLDPTNGGTAPGATVNNSSSYTTDQLPYYCFNTVGGGGSNMQRVTNVYGGYRYVYSDWFETYIISDYLMHNYISEHNPVRTGYTFQNWYYPPTGASVDDDTELKADYNHTLYAKWKANRYTVKLQPNGGTLPSVCTTCTNNEGKVTLGSDGRYSFYVYYDSPMDSLITHNSCSCNLNSISRTGYTFAGWYWNANFSDALYGQNTSNKWQEASDTKVLYAKWQANKYTVTLDANGGHFDQNDETKTFEATFDSVYGNNLNAELAPDRPDSIFRGWFDNKEGTGSEYFMGTLCTTASNHTLYAHWEPKIKASLAQVADSCHGYTDGKIIVSGISGGVGDYVVVIEQAQGNLKDTLNATHPEEGLTTSVTFDGDLLADKGGIPQGKWYVYVYEAANPSPYPTNVDKCFKDSIVVEEPATLAFDRELTHAEAMNCYEKGFVDVHVKGGTSPYTLTWIGSSNPNQQYNLKFYGQDTIIKNLNSQDVYLLLTDDHHCPAMNDTVHVNEADNELADAIRPITKNVCSEQPFEVTPVVFNVSGVEVPSSTRYSWDAPDSLSDLHTGELETTIHDSIHNNTTQSKTYEYFVTPQIGMYCQGEPFKVTVTVAPGTGEAITKVNAITANPVSTCADSLTTLTATFNHSVHDVSYQLVGYNTEGDMLSTNTDNTTFTATFSLPSVCQDSITCIVTAIDNSTCEVQGKDTLVVLIKEWEVTANPGSATVTCLSDAVRPDNQLPQHVTDGCGNELTAKYEYKEFKTDATAWSKTDSFPCSGQVRYTYSYTACDGSSDTWIFTYTVEGMTTADTLVVTDPITVKPADVSSTCAIQVPNLKSDFLSRLQAASTCTAVDNISFHQTPSAGDFINNETYVKVTLTDGCNRVSRYTVKVTVPTKPEVVVTNGSILCHGGKTFAKATVTSGTPDYTYQWNDANEQITETATELSAGSYQVIVKDANGCNAVGFVTLTQPTAIEHSITVSDTVICYGGNVVASANVSGGTTPYIYQWNNGIGNVPVSPIQTLTQNTTYTLSIIDANNCQTEEKSRTVVVNPLPEVTITPADTHICAGGTATLKAVTADAVTYSWGSSDTYTVKPDSVAGVYAYTVTVTQTTGTHCTNTATANVTVHTLPTTTIMNHPAAIAVNDSAVVGVRPLEEGESITWSIVRNVDNTGGNVSIITPNVTEGVACEMTDIKIQGDAIGTVLVSATITQANNPTACNSITVTDTVKVRQSVIHIDCPTPSQDSIIYDGLAHHIENTTVVTNNAGDIITNECTFTYSVDGEVFSGEIPERILAGTTQVTVKASHEQYEPNTCTYALTVNRRPVTVEVADCAPWNGLRDTIQMVLNSNTQYAQGSLELVGNHVLSGMIISSTAAGGVYTYSDTSDVNTASKSGVKVMDGTTDMTANYDIKVNAVQTIVEAQVTSLKDLTCFNKNNGEITVTVTPVNDTYVYYIGDDASNVTHNATGNTATYKNLAAGTYRVHVAGTVADVDHTCLSNEVQNIEIHNIAPIAIAPSDTTIDICAGAAIVLDATASGGSMVYTYEWKDTRNDVVVGTTATVLNVVTVDTTVYKLTVSDYNDPECTATANFTVNVRPGFPTQIVANNQATHVCLNGTLGFSETLNTDNPHCHYKWATIGGENGMVIGDDTNSTANVRWSTAGTKQVTVTVTNDSTGCTSTGFYEVTVDTLPVITITSERWNICLGEDSTTLAASAGEGYLYKWNDENESETRTVKIGVDGNYTVTVTDGNGCQNTATAAVGRYPLPEVQLNNGNTVLGICPGQETATLTATPVEQTYTYIWMRGDIILNNGTPRVTTMNDVTATGSYRVKVIDSVGCYATSNWVTLSHYPIPKVEVNSPSVCESGTATLTANGAQNYTWSPTTYLETNNAVAYFSGAAAGTYTDTVRGTNAHGCWDTAVAIITVVPDIKLLVNNEALLNQQVCAGTPLDSIKIHVEHGSLELVGNLPYNVIFHGEMDPENANDTIDGITYQVGSFNYSIVATSDQTPKCPSKQLNGFIKVNPRVEITLTPAAQDVCAGGDIDTVEITCANGILPTTLDAPQGLTYLRIDDTKARLYGKVANLNATTELSIPVEVVSDQVDPTCATLTENITLMVHPNPVVKIAELPDVCPAQETQEVTANLTTPTTGAYTYYWTGGVWIDPMTTVVDVNSNTVHANVPTVCIDSFLLRVEVTDGFGCYAMDTTMMVVKDTAKPQLTPIHNPVMAKGIGNCKFR